MFFGRWESDFKENRWGSWKSDVEQLDKSYRGAGILKFLMLKEG